MDFFLWGGMNVWSNVDDMGLGTKSAGFEKLIELIMADFFMLLMIFAAWFENVLTIFIRKIKSHNVQPSFNLSLLNFFYKFNTQSVLQITKRTPKKLWRNFKGFVLFLEFNKLIIICLLCLTILSADFAFWPCALRSPFFQ